MHTVQKRFHLFSSLLFALLALGVFLIPENRLPETINHQAFYVFLLLLSAFLIYLPVLIFEKGASVHKKSLVSNMQSVLAFSLILNNAGEFGLYGLYEHGFEYDKFCHFVVPMFFTFILAESLRAWEHFSRWKTALLCLLIVAAAGLLWEIFEFGSDALLNTTLWGVYGEGVLKDTVQDIIFNTLGSLAGIIIFFIPSKKEVRNQKKTA